MVFPYVGRGDLWGNYRSAYNGNYNYNYNGGSRSTPPTFAIATSVLNNNYMFGNPRPRIAQFVCPADSPPEQCALSYVANCGMRDGAGLSTYILGGTSTAGVQPDWQSNGIFHNHYWYPTSLTNPVLMGGTYGVLPSYQVKMSSSDVKDGLQVTLMLSENVQAGEWCEPYATSVTTASAATIGSDTTMSTNVEVYAGMLFGFPSTATTIPQPDDAASWSQAAYPINVARDTDPLTQARVFSRPTYASASTYQYARPSSMHGGGVNAVFCDGHVQFIRQTITPQVFFQLMTPDEHNFRFAANSAIPTAGLGWTLRNNLAPLTAESY
jgi:prepilin-type processing-associated H-X9-DG protein